MKNEIQPPLPILPPRPLSISKSYDFRSQLVPKFLLIIGILLGSSAIAWQVSGAIRIFDDQALWEKGVVAEGKIKGRRSTQTLFFHSYDLDVVYVSQSGTKHEAETHFGTVGRPADWQKLQIKYDPEDPRRFVVSWAIENVRSRWYSWLVVLAGGLLIAGLLVTIGRKLQKRKDILRLCAAESDEVLLDVLDYQRGTIQSPSSITYSIPTGNGSREVFFDRNKESPIYGDPKRGSILALVCKDEPANPHVLMADLRVFDLSKEARHEIDEKLKQRGVEIVNGRCFPIEM